MDKKNKLVRYISLAIMLIIDFVIGFSFIYGIIAITDFVESEKLRMAVRIFYVPAVFSICLCLWILFEIVREFIIDYIRGRR